MSQQLYLFGRRVTGGPTLSHQRVRSRNHLRIWESALPDNGETLGSAAPLLTISDANATAVTMASTHKIDSRHRPSKRDYVEKTLSSPAWSTEITHFLPKNHARAKTANADNFHSNGQLLI